MGGHTGGMLAHLRASLFEEHLYALDGHASGGGGGGEERRLAGTIGGVEDDRRSRLRENNGGRDAVLSSGYGSESGL